MSEIVERLRNASPHLIGSRRDVVLEAAARIERLEEENEKLRVGMISLLHILSKHGIKINEHTEAMLPMAEYAALRAALGEEPKL